MPKSRSQKIGSRWSVDFITRCIARGLIHVKPVGLQGGGFTGRDKIDVGDVEHFPDSTVELKDTQDDWGDGFKQMQAAQVNTGSTWGWLCKRYRGRAPGAGYAVCVIDQAITITRLIVVLRAMVGEHSYQEALTWARGNNPVDNDDPAPRPVSPLASRRIPRNPAP